MHNKLQHLSQLKKSRGDILEWSQLLFGVIIAVMVFYTAVVLASTTTHEKEKAQQEQLDAMNGDYLLLHYLSLPVEMPLKNGVWKGTMAELLDVAVHNPDVAIFAKGRTEEFFFHVTGSELGWEVHVKREDMKRGGMQQREVKEEMQPSQMRFGIVEGGKLSTATTATLPSANPNARIRVTLIMPKGWTQ